MTFVIILIKMRNKTYTISSEYIYLERQGQREFEEYSFC